MPIRPAAPNVSRKGQYGNCAVAAPDVCDLDPDTNIVLVKPGRPTDVGEIDVPWFRSTFPSPRSPAVRRPAPGTALLVRLCRVVRFRSVARSSLLPGT